MSGDDSPSVELSTAAETRFTERKRWRRKESNVKETDGSLATTDFVCEVCNARTKARPAPLLD